MPYVYSSRARPDGNGYVVVKNDGKREQIVAHVNSAEKAKRIADKRNGVGSGNVPSGGGSGFGW